jgi:hypothetical protein
MVFTLRAICSSEYPLMRLRLRMQFLLMNVMEAGLCMLRCERTSSVVPAYVFTILPKGIATQPARILNSEFNKTYEKYLSARGF